jgi:2-succinyl-6-hydroxy-2,4-cyclohexadiene-1-carboxylate synthase
VVITALHGFLGLPSDWDFLRDAAFDIATPPLDAIPNEGEVLLGYSMGGRLALHVLLRGATYQRAVIVSAGLGVEGEGERAARRAADEAWARRFETEEWSSLMRAWNAQPLFGAHELPRQERDFDRAALARALRDESPAALPPVAGRLLEITIPVLWIAGERDPRYVNEGRRAVQLLPNAELWICPGAAHRVPWEQPGRFIERLTPLR